MPDDYNSDGVVDAADYSVWRESLGDSGTGLAADGNRDNQVALLDYDLWRAHYGEAQTGAGESTQDSAPEPTTMALVLFCVTGAVASWRRSWH